MFAACSAPYAIDTEFAGTNVQQLLRESDY